MSTEDMYTITIELAPKYVDGVWYPGIKVYTNGQFLDWRVFDVVCSGAKLALTISRIMAAEEEQIIRQTVRNFLNVHSNYYHE